MTINARESDRVLADLLSMDEMCPASQILRTTTCRTSAFSDACVDGTCVILDAAGKNLGTTTVGPDEGEPLPE